MRHSYDHLIIGGGIAGVTAAETIRSRDARATICVLGAERHPLYSRVLLPHVADRRSTAAKAVLKTPDGLAAKGIEYVVGVSVASVDVPGKTVMLADGSRIGYGALLIATGTSPRHFGGPGGEHCMAFHALDDLEPFEDAVSGGHAVVYGGGFNAIDLATSFVRRGTRVTAVVRGDGHLARIMDPASRDMIRAELVAHGVEIRARAELAAVERAGSRRKAFLAGGGVIECGAVAVSIGVEPNVAFLSGSGIPVGTGVLTDERLAAAPGVFAAGDVAEYFDVHLGARRIAGNWQNAMFQGKVAGANMTGDAQRFAMVTSYSIPCFTLPVSVLGAVDVPGAERIARIVPGVGVLQVIVSNGRAVGATCVGPFSARAVVTKLIADEVPLTEAMRSVIADPAADLVALLP